MKSEESYLANKVCDGRTDGRTDVRTDVDYSYGPPPGVTGDN